MTTMDELFDGSDAHELDTEYAKVVKQRDELLTALGSMLFDLGNFDTDEERIAEFRRLRRQARKLVPNG